MEEEVDFRQLRYPSPDVSAYELEDYLSLEELDFIVDNMEVECNKFEKYSTALSQLQMREAGKNDDENDENFYDVLSETKMATMLYNLY